METIRKLRSTTYQIFFAGVSYFRQRYYIAIMLNTGLVLCLTYRLILSLAMIEITHLNLHLKGLDSGVSHLSELQNGPSYDWDSQLQGIIKASFFPGYILSHVPGGYASDAFGGRLLFGQAIIVCGLLTILSPFCTYISPYLLIVNRFLQGLSQGPLFAALNSMLAQWSPPNERTRLSVIANTGVVIGQVLGNAMVGQTLHLLDDWAYSFYLFGALSIPWCLLWFGTVTNSPTSNPFIKSAEKDLILSSLVNETNTIKTRHVPWGQIFFSIPFWVLVLVNFGQDWGFYTINVDLPKFVHDILHVNISEIGIFSALPWFVLFFVTTLTAFLTDWFISEGYVTKTCVRKSFATIASVGSATFMVAASYSCESTFWTMFMIVMCVAMFGFVYVSVRVNTLDIAPNFAGLVFAFVNGFGAFAGVFSPLLIGFLTVNNNVEEWRVCFWIVATIMLVTLLPFLIFGTAKVQPWNEITPLASQVPATPNTSQKPETVDKSQTTRNLNEFLEPETQNKSQAGSTVEKSRTTETPNPQSSEYHDEYRLPDSLSRPHKSGNLTESPISDPVNEFKSADTTTKNQNLESLNTSTAPESNTFANTDTLDNSRTPEVLNKYQVSEDLNRPQNLVVITDKNPARENEESKIPLELVEKLKIVDAMSTSKGAQVIPPKALELLDSGKLTDEHVIADVTETSEPPHPPDESYLSSLINNFWMFWKPKKPDIQKILIKTEEPPKTTEITITKGIEEAGVSKELKQPGASKEPSTKERTSESSKEPKIVVLDVTEKPTMKDTPKEPRKKSSKFFKSPSTVEALRKNEKRGNSENLRKKKHIR